MKKAFPLLIIGLFILCAILPSACSDYDDFEIKQTDILGKWESQQTISFDGVKMPLFGTLEFFNTVFVTTDVVIVTRSWGFVRNTGFRRIKVGEQYVQILELTENNMIWKFDDTETLAYFTRI